MEAAAVKNKSTGSSTSGGAKRAQSKTLYQITALLIVLLLDRDLSYSFWSPVLSKINSRRVRAS
jgi:hypothetical protein